MSWDEEFLPDDPAELDLPGEEPGEDEEEPDPDLWLEDLDEETRQRVVALAEARAQTASLETERRFRTGLGRWGRAQQNLSEQLGLVVDEHGNVAPADPEKLQQFVQQFGAPAYPYLPLPAEDPMPDPTYDPQGFREWMAQQIEYTAEAKAEAKVAGLRAGIVQQALPAAEMRARELLEVSGFGALVDDEQFSALFGQSLQSVPQDQWGDDEVLETVAYMLIPTLKRRAAADPARSRALRRSPAEFAADVHRASLAQTSPGRGGTRQLDGRYQAELIAEARSNGMTPEEWEAMGDPDAAWRFMDRRSRKGRR